MQYDFSRYLNIRSALNPCLAQAGDHVAFLSDITGNYQVWSTGLKASGQEAWPRQLSFFADKVWELHRSPAGDQLLALSDVGGNEKQQFYLISGFGFEPEQGLEVRRLTQDADAVHHFGAWNKDGKSIVFTSNARNKVDFDCYFMDLASGEARLVQECSGLCDIKAWSPDGRYLLVSQEVGSLQVELYLHDLESGTQTHLTSDCPPACYSHMAWADDGLYLLSDRTNQRGALCRMDPFSSDLEELFSPAALGFAENTGELEAIRLSPAGDTAALVFNANGYSQICLLSLATGQTRRPQNLPAGVMDHLAFSPDGQSLVFDLQTPKRNQDIWRLDLASLECGQITFSNRAGIPESSFVEPQAVFFPSFDGLELPGFYYLPQTPAPEGGYPCILYVHGGPASQIRPDFDLRFQYFLGRGYAILAPNVRGSSGYGREYTALDEVEKRPDSVRDLEYAVKWLKSRDELDPARIAIYGRSYGGFMVLAAMTAYPDLFKAGIDVVGISNWVTFLERTSAYRRKHREKEYGSLERDRELLASISPVHKLHLISAPLLVLAGDNDPRVPVSESERVAAKVAQAGGVVEFVHYADEGHKFSKLKNRIDSFTRMGDFLARHL